MHTTQKPKDTRSTSATVTGPKVRDKKMEGKKQESKSLVEDSKKLTSKK